MASFSVSSGDSGDAAAARDCEDCTCAVALSSSSSVALRFLGGITSGPRFLVTACLGSAAASRERANFGAV